MPKMYKHWTKGEVEGARERLLKDYALKPGDTIYGIVRSVARSGMSRRIDFVVTCPEVSGRPRIYSITWCVRVLLDYPKAGANAPRRLRVDGCGMDMVFHTVYSLGRVLFADGIPGEAKKAADPGYAFRSEVL